MPTFISPIGYGYDVVTSFEFLPQLPPQWQTVAWNCELKLSSFRPHCFSVKVFHRSSKNTARAPCMSNISPWQQATTSLAVFSLINVSYALASPWHTYVTVVASLQTDIYRTTGISNIADVRKMLENQTQKASWWMFNDRPQQKILLE